MKLLMNFLAMVFVVCAVAPSYAYPPETPADILKTVYEQFPVLPDELSPADFHQETFAALNPELLAQYGSIGWTTFLETLETMRPSLNIERHLAVNLIKLRIALENAKNFRPFEDPKVPGKFNRLTEAQLKEWTAHFPESVNRPASDAPFAKPQKIATLQFSPMVTDYEGTANKVIAMYQEAVKNGATMVVTPELILPGYGAQDLLSTRPEVLTRSLAALEKIRKATEGSTVPLVIGHLDGNPNPNGRRVQNVASVFVNGQKIYRQAKWLLPTYRRFDDGRHFEPGTDANVFEIDGVKYGILICEDGWFMDDHDGRLIYKRDPLDKLIRQGVQVIINVSASPYTAGKRDYRHKVFGERARKAGVPVVFVNYGGDKAADDHLLWDGTSSAYDAKGNLVGSMRSFSHEDEIGYVHLRSPNDVSYQRKIDEFVAPREYNPDPGVKKFFNPEMEVKLQALLTGIRAYVHKTGHKKLVLGISGGIDSTISAALAVMALGKENVVGQSMPSKFSPGHSKSDADLLADALGIRLVKAPIESMVEEERALAELMDEQLDAFEGKPKNYTRILLKKLFPRSWVAKILGELSTGVPDENLQARARMILLYRLANRFAQKNEGTLVMTTGCKSELAMGWCTKFGDHAGDLNAVGDLFKTEEIELGYYINARQRSLGRPDLIPSHILKKPPSPDLKPGQLTSHTLPPYEILDPLLRDYMDAGLSVEALTAKHGKNLPQEHPSWTPTWVQDNIKRFDAAENKRDTAAVVLSVTSGGFGQKWRRVPVARKTERSAAAISCLDALGDLNSVENHITARP